MSPENPNRTAAELHHLLIQNHLTIAIAESSTGGVINAMLTQRAGSSAFYRGGIVAYDHRSKTDVLRIPASLFEEYGSVSAEASKAMAEAARSLFQSDLAIAESSILGPGGATGNKPVGLTFVAVATSAGTTVREARFKGSRSSVRHHIALLLVEMVVEAIEAHKR